MIVDESVNRPGRPRSCRDGGASDAGPVAASSTLPGPVGGASEAQARGVSVLPCSPAYRPLDHARVPRVRSSSALS